MILYIILLMVFWVVVVVVTVWAVETLEGRVTPTVYGHEPPDDEDD